MRTFLVAMAVTAAFAGFPQHAAAVGLEGNLALTGEVRVTSDGVIDWLTLEGATGGGTGEALIGSTSGGYFDAFDNFGDIATEKDLVDAALPRDADGFLDDPLEDFQTFTTSLNDVDLPGLTFTLERILPCEDYAENPAEQCDAGPQSPFAFLDTATGVTVFLNMSGTAFDANAPELGVATWTGLWDASFTDTTTAALLELLFTQGFIDSPYSAVKITVNQDVVPEPASLLLLGTGLVGLAGRAHRKRRSKS